MIDVPRVGSVVDGLLRGARHVLVALATTLVACRPSAPSTPAQHADVGVYLILDGMPVDDAIAATRVWTDYLRVSVDVRTFGRVECPAHWWRSTTPCQLTVYMFAVDGLREKAGTNALSNRDLRVAQFDTRLLGHTFNLRVAIAHEVGHVLLDTSEHTAGGVMGGVDVTLSDADRALATRMLAR